MMRYLLLIMLLLLVGCQPDATPFPVNIPSTPTETPLAQTAADAPIRYALAANTTNAVPNLELISSTAQIFQIADPVNPADLTTSYDLIAAYGDLPDGTRSPVVSHVSLLINTQLSPLDDTALTAIVRQAVDTRAIVNTLTITSVSLDTDITADTLALRTAFANAGLPDGLELNGVSAYALGVDAVQSTLSAAGIDTRWGLLTPDLLEAAMESGRVHLALVMWTSLESKAAWQTIVDEGNMIDLFSVPISYLAADGLTITFASNGFPLATR
jgi:hypothetical protein